MNERLREYLKQQIQTCEVALMKNPNEYEKGFWEGRQLAYILVQSEGWNIPTQERTTYGLSSTSQYQENSQS